MKQSTISFLLNPDEFKLLASIVYLEPFLDEILSLKALTCPRKAGGEVT